MGILKCCLILPQMVVNQDKEAIMCKEAHYPTEAVVGAAARDVVVASGRASPLRRRWQVWKAMTWLELVAWRRNTIGHVCRGRAAPLAAPVPGWQVVQIWEAERQSDGVEA